MEAMKEQTAVAPANRLDWPLIIFFLLAYLIAWGLIPVLAGIARQSGVDDWITLSQMAETLNFADVELAAPGWVVYLITRLQDFAFSLAGIVMILLVNGRSGLKQLVQRLTQWRIGWRWWLLALLPFGLYAVATVVSGATGSFVVNGRTLYTILFSAEAGLLVTLFLRGPMGEELGLISITLALTHPILVER
ncbi:MAG: hypothetical protein KC445_09595, partial [Anaerolineales bacterium]|nr:hypothetical protein [Anaerolineales bacterium]